MNIISDLHIHGRFSRGCSTALNLGNLEKYAKIKGVDLLGTGDFTHPKWIEEIKTALTEDGSGILKTKNNFPFVLQTEISLVYTQDNKGRRVHNVVLAPDLDTVNQITEYLLKHGRIDYDGRPIFKISCPEFTESLKQINKDIEVIPAHAWTPWFSIFGSKSGFDSVEEAFHDQAKRIHAIETGLSSDPAMNWRISALDKYALVSFSDLHSFWPWRIGREATIFDMKRLTYKELIDCIKNKKITETIEFNPKEGKYHFDGHRKCGICFTPKESMAHNNICPVCKRPLTIGVLNRVEELADRPEGFTPKNAPPFKNLIPLSELIAGFYKTSPSTKKVWAIYNSLISEFKSENNILLNTSQDLLEKFCDKRLAELIIKNRNQKIEFNPGFDGEYGKPILNQTIEQKTKKELSKSNNSKTTPAIVQKGLSDF